MPAPHRLKTLTLVAGAGFLLAGCGGARAFGSGLASPLEDLNLKRDRIPAVLMDARSDPYREQNLQSCRAIAWEVRALDEALGPDEDEPPAPVDAGREAGYAAGSLVSGLAVDAAVGFWPVRDWVRQLSGAERRSREVQSAVQSGRVRRAFMKGMGMRMNCPPPAAPSWFRPRQAGSSYRYETRR